MLNLVVRSTKHIWIPIAFACLGLYRDNPVVAFDGVVTVIEDPRVE